mmetsp:Transcript_22721/g.71475  ORF Transcript_22721/g.71475 Transcript_22721/m.71475 type:complete len:209 (+) Transcript_22721:186-812(+)
MAVMHSEMPITPGIFESVATASVLRWSRPSPRPLPPTTLKRGTAWEQLRRGRLPWPRCAEAGGQENGHRSRKHHASKVRAPVVSFACKRALHAFVLPTAEKRFDRTGRLRPRAVGNGGNAATAAATRAPLPRSIGGGTALSPPCRALYMEKGAAELSSGGQIIYSELNEAAYATPQLCSCAYFNTSLTRPSAVVAAACPTSRFATVME